MRRGIVLFMLGFITAVGGIYSLHAWAATGDVLYEAPAVKQCITAAQASCYATCAQNDGTWAGTKANMIRVIAQRQSGCYVDTENPSNNKNFSAIVIGFESAPAANVPAGSIFHGVE